MRILDVSISDIDFQKFDLKNDQLTFSDLIDLVTDKLVRQNLEKCLTFSEKYGISNMTMDEITNEVKAVRQKNN